MIRIGSRKSQLALAQTALVASAIETQAPEEVLEVCTRETLGDRNKEVAIASFGGKGAFTREIEEAMIRRELDLAVHSAKDLPMEMTEGLKITAVLPRGDARDMLVSLSPGGIASLPGDATVGTGSKRRALQILELCPEVMIKDIRGNVPTRLMHLAEENYDAIVLAAAGIKRLGLLPEDAPEYGSFTLNGYTFYYELFNAELFLPAAGQGIIAVQGRIGEYKDLMDAVNDDETMLYLAAERAFLQGIGGGCNEAAAIHCRIEWDHLLIRAKYAGMNEKMEMALVRKPLPKSQEARLKLARECGLLAARRLLQYVNRENDGDR